MVSSCSPLLFLLLMFLERDEMLTDWGLVKWFCEDCKRRMKAGERKR